MSYSRIFSRRLVPLLALALCFSATNRIHAQETAKRLILKDGSYQLVTKYEVKGDRVRYLSSERNEWEELPSSLVDWPATEKYEKDRSTPSAIPEAKELDKEAEAEHAAEEIPLPEVAPGLRLPDDSGVYLLDNFQGEPQIVELQQAEGDVNANTKGNIFRGALNPAASAKQTIELDGAHATVKAHVAVPSIYINVEDVPDQPPPGQTTSARPSLPSLDAPRQQQPQQPEQAEGPVVPFGRFRLVHIKVKNGKRIVGDVKRSVTGKVSQDENFVKTTIDRVNGGWFKVTPTQELEPGEYAIIETRGREGMNLYVWDFSFDPKAPANPNPWKPQKSAEKPGDQR
ncbi:MAG TPA: hypothetical protein VND65_06730 [Candidatus Binatia bacterium]|nr:hypothetical protein [Candidatus Binatia bacterium]